MHVVLVQGFVQKYQNEILNGVVGKSREVCTFTCRYIDDTIFSDGTIYIV